MAFVQSHELSFGRKEGRVPEYLHPGVYVQEESSGAKPIEGASTSTAAFVGLAPRGRPNRPTFVTSWTQFERAFGGLKKGYDMPLAVYQFFQNGGVRAYVVRVLREKGANPTDPVALSAKGTISPALFSKDVKIEAAGGGVWGNDLRVSVRLNAFSHNVPKEEDPAGSGHYKDDDGRPYLYDWLVEMKDASGAYKEVEAFSALGCREDGDKFYATLINRDSQYIRIKVNDDGGFSEGPTDRKPSALAKEKDEPGTFVFAQPPAAIPSNPNDKDKLGGGSDGPAAETLTAKDYENSLKTLDRVDDASILVIAGASHDVAMTGASYVHNRPLGDMIYVVDSPRPSPDQSAEDQISAVKEFAGKFSPKTSYGALYFPWVMIPDPYSSLAGATRLAPPSGMIAGLYARTDNTRGVWKAPAGTEASLLGAVGLASQVNDADQDTLNPIGVNCIRQFPGAGIVVWGSRTLSTQSNPEYRYVPVRRFTSFLKVSLYRGTQWVVFEPNDEPLWASIRFNLNAFMSTLFRAGALQGGKPAEAFLVKCDAENNIQATIDAGQVHILVAFAPLKPAEFVIIHIQQMRKQ